MITQEPARPLVFAARRPPRRLLILMSVLVLSALVHAVSFYILQVAYTPTVTLPPPPAEVTLLAPGSSENLALNQWLAMADPALMTNPSGGKRALSALTFAYVPSYASAPPAYRPLNLTPEVVAPPAGNIFDLAALPPIKVAPRRVSPSVPSSVALDSSLAALAPRPLPPLSLSLPVAAATKPLDPTVFLVGPRPEGGAPFVFRQSSSGNAFADEYARAYLGRLALGPAGESPRWGWAAFYWGAEVYRPAP